MNKISVKNLTHILLSVLIFFVSGCVLSEYGSKTKDAVVKSLKYIGEKSKSFYQASKETLGFDKNNEITTKPMTVSKSSFGKMPDGTEASKYTLTNANGMKVGILDYGGTVKDIYVPDRDGQLGNVSLGLPTISDYIEKAHILDV